MDYLIVEEFNRFWALFAVNERLYPHRRACTLNLWMKMPQEKRSAIIEEIYTLLKQQQTETISGAKRGHKGGKC